jgi:ABC-type glutathione transport system ATPase component
MAIPSRRLGRSPRSPAPATAPARNERLAPLAAYTQRMNRVLDHIDKHLDESLEVTALAAIAHFSPFHFHRVFTAWMGETLGDYLRSRTGSLPLGQKQRLALGVALMHEAPIIVLDEPTSGLDGTNMRNVSRMIRKLAKMGRTIIVITHDAECALACCERAMRLENGYITDDFQIRGAELLLEKIGYDQKEG